MNFEVHTIVFLVSSNMTARRMSINLNFIFFLQFLGPLYFDGITLNDMWASTRSPFRNLAGLIDEVL
jgi:hypothetical protein